MVSKELEEQLNKEFAAAHEDLNVKKEIVLEVNHLSMYFPINVGFMKTKPLKAVDDVSFTVKRGETVGLVGESGCGKTTLGRTILQLYKPTGGRIIFNGQRVNPGTKMDIEELTGKINDMKELILELQPKVDAGDSEAINQTKLAKDRIARLERNIEKINASKKYYKGLIKEFRKHAQMIFQDPYSSLDPRMTVEDIIAEPLDAHKICKTKEERHRRVEELMKMVGLSSEHATRYAHEFSGGQRQRIGIARALALNPEFIVCDEPVSALDVSIQAQVINLLMELQEKKKLTYMFITHNLSVAHHISNTICVMYLGQVIEYAERNELFSNTLHPYSQALLSAIPVATTKKRRNRIILNSELTSPVNPAPGCRFAPRCIYAKPECSKVSPVLKDMGGGHLCACHFAGDIG